ncbi:uncharacterized protein LOC143034628 [Oratosquilla oratoria]|uniref:uncharacterized protein LOC143034628 n=1 Tax=Oratosquilla oratoria TaxID=337810 RepID=UPI003F7593B8
MHVIIPITILKLKSTITTKPNSYEVEHIYLQLHQLERLGVNTTKTYSETVFKWNLTLDQVSRFCGSSGTLMALHTSMLHLLFLGGLLAEMVAFGVGHVVPRKNIKRVEGCPCPIIPSPYANLDEVDCFNLKLTEVPTKCFSEDIAVVNLAGNWITQIGPSDFDNLKNLRHLDLDHNKIEFVDSVAFRGLTSMIDLHMANNKHLASLPEDIFHGLPNLKRIHFYTTSLEILPDFSHQTNIELLNADNCQLSRLRRPSFGEVTTSVAFIYLGGNNISHAAFDSISSFHDITYFFFDHTVTLWAQTREELEILLEKPYHFNFETVPPLGQMKVCFDDGFPNVDGICDLGRG